jgi:hypothetical protein
MNILEIEDIIKGLPDQSLIQEAQAPSGQMPQFLVVSEIQRRADMRKRFQNQQQEMPQGTIADQILQSGIASMGNRQPIQSMPPQGMPSQGMPPMPPQGMPQGMPQQGMPMQQQPPMSPPMPPPMSPPMMPPAQGMAAGGVVRMQKGEDVPYTGGTMPSDNTDRRQAFLDNIAYNIRQQEISAMKDPKTDYMQQSYYSPPSMLDYAQEEMISGIQGKLDAGTPITQKEIRILENYGPGYDYSKKLASLKEIDTGVIPERMTIEDMSSISKTLSTGETPSLESLLQYKSPLSFGDNYNVENPLDMDPKRFYETTLAQDLSN